MKKIKRIKEIIGNPYKILAFLQENIIFLRRIIPDRVYLKIKFRGAIGKPLRIDNPQTFNEKLQWLKLYDRKPEYTMMVDKFEVRKYIAETIGEEYLIPCLGTWERAEDIDFDALPNQFVLKCNHNSGGLCICKDKSVLNIKKVRMDLKKSLKQNYYYLGREWPYKNVGRKIIAEKYMVDESGYELKDYKFFCFNGTPKMMFIASDRQLQGEETKFDFYDMNFNHLPFVNGHPNKKSNQSSPDSFIKMRELAERLSKNIPQVRVDFYDINGKIYFGELTFFHWSGFVPFEPIAWDYTIGSWLELPNVDLDRTC